ncbi:integral membrane protein [Apilactobacillus ozensis DSM 23829 = JCM 17196]|uniref:Integral membrane protein n=1 Tax=Apilactobacillus ozensis DSM 23829 = JCM 17196 TaxID=1423781 RepID=A0A0R2AL57_9LACO|nr:integral membrane protein [Apilactobacillus ozensis DSM 23829 = JCM 17196]
MLQYTYVKKNICKDGYMINYWLLALTFLSVNLDFFFMLIFLVKKYNLRQSIIGYIIGVTVILTLSFIIGQTLAYFIPEWMMGILGLLPIYMALKDDDDEDNVSSHKSPILSFVITYLSVCAGCNLSIFLPVLIGISLKQFIIILIFINTLTIVVTIIVKFIADIRLVNKVMQKYGEKLMKICYILVGLYVLWDSGLIEHLIKLL